MPSRKKKPAAEKRRPRPRGSGRPGSRAAASGARSPAAGARAAPPRRKTAASAQTQTPPPAPTPRAPLPGASDRLEQRAHTASRQSAGRRAEHLGYLLTAYILENISADGRREVESHVEECGECRRELAELRRTLAAVEDVLAPPAAGRGGEACAAYSFEERRLRRVLAASRQRPAWRRGIVIACSSAAALIVVVLGLGLLLSGLTEKKAYRLADGGARRYEAELAGRHDNTPGVWSESSHGEDSSAPPYVRGRAAAKYGQDPEAPGKMEEDAAAQEISPADGPAGAAGEEPARKRVARGFAIAPPADSGADELSVKPERLDLVASAPAAEEAPAQEGEGAMVTVESRFLDEGDVAVEAEEIAEPAEERIIFGADVDDDGVVFGEDEDVLSDLELEAPRQEAAAAGTGVAGKPLAAPRPPPPTARAEDPAARAASGRVQQLAKGLKSSSSAVRGPAAAATATPAPTPAPPAYDPTVQRDMSRTTGGRAGRDRGSVAGGGDVTVEIPKGADLEKMSNFNLNADSIKEAIRAGGEAAGAARNFDFAIKRSETRSIQDLEEKPGTTQAGDDLSYLPRLQDRLQNLQNGQTTLYGNGRVLHRARQDVDLLAAHRGIELSREGEPPPPVSAGIAPEAASSLERSLRAYAYYNSLSPSLTLEQFRAHALEIPQPAVGDEGLGREGFRKKHGVNPFVSTDIDNLSTFGLDVDTASYRLARRLIAAGKLPDPKSVRVEEFVNSFPEALSVPPEQVFAAFSEGGPSPFRSHLGLDLLKITIKSRELLAGERPAAVLTFAVDTSGSMARSDYLEQVRQALGVLVESLEPSDRVAVVAFSSSAYLLLPPTSLRQKDRILAALDALSPLGGTHVEAGLDLAYRIASESFQPRALNRIVLCTDGAANLGAREPEELLQKARVHASRGVYLSVVGFGREGYRDELLQRLADEADGNYHYVSSAAEAARIFRDNLPSTLHVLARNAKIQVVFDKAVVRRYRLIGYEKRDIADEKFRDDTVDAGEVGPGSTVTVLYEIERRAASAGSLGVIQLRYVDVLSGRSDAVEVRFDIPPGVLKARVEETSARLRFLACVAQLAELLRGSYYARGGSFGEVIARLASLPEELRATEPWREVFELAMGAQALSLENLVRMVR